MQALLFPEGEEVDKEPCILLAPGMFSRKPAPRDSRSNSLSLLPVGQWGKGSDTVQEYTRDFPVLLS